MILLDWHTDIIRGVLGRDIDSYVSLKRDG